MKGKDLGIGPKERTKEQIAKDVLTRVQERIDSLEEDLKVAKEHMAILLEKDVNEFTSKDDDYWDW